MRPARRESTSAISGPDHDERDIVDVLLDARHAISVTERQRFILRVRTLARGVAQAYFDARAALGFPLAEEGIRKEVLGRIEAEGK